MNTQRRHRKESLSMAYKTLSGEQLHRESEKRIITRHDGCIVSILSCKYRIALQRSDRTCSSISLSLSGRRGKTIIPMCTMCIHSVSLIESRIYQCRNCVDLHRKISERNVFIGILDEISPNRSIILNNAGEFMLVFPRRSER